MLFLDPSLVFHVYEVQFIIGLLLIDPTLHWAKSLVRTLRKWMIEKLAAVVYGFLYAVLKERVQDTPTAFGQFYGLLARWRAALAGGNFTPCSVQQGHTSERNPSAGTKPGFTGHVSLD